MTYATKTQPRRPVQIGGYGYYRGSIYTLGCVILLMCLGTTIAAAQTYKLTDLGSFIPTDLNAQGAMAGRWCEASGCKPALRTTDGQVTIAVEAIGDAFSINSTQQMLVVLYETANHRGVWSPTTGYQDLPLGQGVGIFPAAMNDTGVVVGMMFLSDRDCPAQWDSPTSDPVCRQEVQMGESAWATSIDTKGDVITSYGTGYLLSKVKGTAIPLNFPVDDFPNKLTDAGHVLGFNGYWRYKGLSTGQLKTLPGCESILSVDMLSTRRAVGQTVCSALYPWPQFSQRATVWPSDYPKDLNKLVVKRPKDWHLMHAMGIAPNGSIVGLAAVGTDDLHAVRRGFLLTPVSSAAKRLGLQAETDDDPVLLTDDPGYDGPVELPIRLQMLGVE